jgi:PAS domain S-box-containing protein
MESNEEHFRTIADFTYDWEYWMAPDGSLHWVSPSCERITGYRPEEFYQDPTLIYTITHPDDRLVVKDFLKETSDVRFIHLDFRIIRRDGQVRWISHNSQSVFGADGSWQGRRASNRDVTGRKEVEEQLLEYQRELRSLASELVLAEERERRSIAVDLHDRVGHTLAMAQIKLNQLQMVTDDPEALNLLDEAVGLVEESIADTRSLTMDLSPPALYELGLDAALDELAHEIQDQHKIRTEVVDDGNPKPLGPDAKVALYRATRELMINAVKHSQSPNLRVTLSRRADKIVVEVIDQGRGFDPSSPRVETAKTKSFGLFSIRERIRHMNGEIEIDSKPGQGTRITLITPLESKE